MQHWAAKIRQGDTRALARAATGIENGDSAAVALLSELGEGHARIVGITGPPGAGKSTLVDAMARELRRRNQTVAVIAVDPSSSVSGGALLGDRIRMLDHYSDPGIFIRSMASRGELGGVARATSDMARLMSAAGKDWVLIETVGVGQAEVAIAAVADVTVLVVVPGAGDDVQAIKAGVLEVAQIIAVNKADLPGAANVERDLRAELDHPTILQTVAARGIGVPELIAAIETITEEKSR